MNIIRKRLTPSVYAGLVNSIAFGLIIKRDPSCDYLLCGSEESKHTQLIVQKER